MIYPSVGVIYAMLGLNHPTVDVIYPDGGVIYVSGEVVCPGIDLRKASVGVIYASESVRKAIVKNDRLVTEPVALFP